MSSWRRATASSASTAMCAARACRSRWRSIPSTRVCSGPRRPAPSASTTTATTTDTIWPASRIRRRARIVPRRAPAPSPTGNRGADVGEPFLMRALIAGIGLAIVAAPLGCFVVWRRMAYYGETVAQAGLIGIAAGLALSLNLTASVLVVTLAVSALLVLLSRQQLVPFDSLLGLLAHAALAIGVILASLVRGPQLDLMAFLFGDIFAISSTDLKWICVGGALALAALVYVWRPLLS